MIINGEALEELKKIDSSSIDSIVTDPPYGLSFMGKKWDYDVPSVEIWKECLRVLKPGGYLLSFAGTRTQHRMAVNIEDAGFEIRDMIAWVYGSGFPKSLNIGKAVDKLQGNEREVVGIDNNSERFKEYKEQDGCERKTFNDKITKGTSEWEGWGTALKPALEPITVARKPLSEKTVAENCLKWGTGGINIDECRVGTEEMGGGTMPDLRDVGAMSKEAIGIDKLSCGQNPRPALRKEQPTYTGRFPANICHDGSDEVVEKFPITEGKPNFKRNATSIYGSNSDGSGYNGQSKSTWGSAARFFYCAKSSRRERNCGLDSYITVKYNECESNNKNLCKEENMVAVQLLEKVMSAMGLMSFSTGESGENIMVQCHKDSLSTTLTEIKQIIESKILNSLMLSLTSESTQDVNLETESGGSLVENVENLKKFLLTITNGQMELALGANRVALKMLSLISEEENWKPATNIHSTVKPIALMEYLVKLVSREGAKVLDPFMGSGTTGIACKNLNREFIGIEMDKEYCKIAEARIKSLPNKLI